jgi:hypothetical protein
MHRRNKVFNLMVAPSVQCGHACELQTKAYGTAK